MALSYTTTNMTAFTDSQYGTAVNATALKTLVNQYVDTKFHRQVQKKQAYKRFGLIGPDAYSEGDSMGTAPGYPVLSKTELQSNPGDVIKMSQRRNLVSDHLTGGKVLDAQLVDNETDFDIYSLKVSIERWREGTKGFGGMSRQRNPFGETLEQMQEGVLQDYAANIKDTSILYAQHSGFSPHQYRAYGVTNCAPTQNPNFLVGNDTTFTTTRTAANLTGTTQDNIKAQTFEIASAYMEQNDFDPVFIRGKAYWVAFISPQAKMFLLQDTRFQNAQLYAAPRSTDNPLFVAADFVYGNCLILVYDKIRSILGGNNPAGLTVGSNQITEAAYTSIGGGVTSGQLHQTLFCGANAIAFAEGSTRLVGRKEDDYGNILGTDVDMIFGVRRFDATPETGSATNQSSLLVLNTTLS